MCGLPKKTFGSPYFYFSHDIYYMYIRIGFYFFYRLSCQCNIHAAKVLTEREFRLHQPPLPHLRIAFIGMRAVCGDFFHKSPTASPVPDKVAKKTI